MPFLPKTPQSHGCQLLAIPPFTRPKLAPDQISVTWYDEPFNCGISLHVAVRVAVVLPVLRIRTKTPLDDAPDQYSAG
jgi:hypothetical protein